MTEARGVEGWAGALAGIAASMARAESPEAVAQNAQVPSEVQERLVLQERRRLARELHDFGVAGAGLDDAAGPGGAADARAGWDRPWGPLGRRIAKLRELTEGARTAARAAPAAV